MDVTTALAVLTTALTDPLAVGVAGNAAWDGIKKAASFLARIVTHRPGSGSTPPDVANALASLPPTATAQQIAEVVLPLLAAPSVAIGSSTGPVAIGNVAGGDLAIHQHFHQAESGQTRDAEDDRAYQAWLDGVFAALGQSRGPNSLKITESDDRRWATRACREGALEWGPRVGNGLSVCLPGTIDRNA